MNYRQTLEFLFTRLPVFQHTGTSAYKPGLDRTLSFLEHLGQPHRSFLSVHIAGTNGKGSTSHILASVMQRAGYRTGLYTSPHLHDFRERIKIDSEQISEEQVVEFVEKHHQAMDGMSFFEMSVGMAFDHFVRNGVEVAIIETGLGGRLDSTNVITPLVSVITNIGLDHMNLLGDTLEEIALQKAGIIKSGVPVVIGEYDRRTANLFRARAAQVGAPILFADSRYRAVEAVAEDGFQRITIQRDEDGETFDIDIDLLGDYQRKNVVTALAALDKLKECTELTISRESVDVGFRHAAASTGLHGRWEILGDSPLTVCDTAHNEHGLKIVTAQIARQRYKRLYVVFGVVSDKDLDSILPLMPSDAYYIFTQASIERAMPAEALQHRAEAYGLKGEVVVTVERALKRAKTLATAEDMIFIGGSTFTVADIILID